MAFKQEVLVYNPAEEAVADAMMATQSKILLGPLEQCKSSCVNIEALLANLSHAICDKASLYALAYLTEKYSSLFGCMFLMQASRTPKRDFLKAGMLHHAFFAVKDNGGMWFAGSPANHNPDIPKDKNPMTKIIRGSSLVEVISVIEKEEGGIWPTADFIEAQMPAYYGRPRIYRGNEKRLHQVCVASYNASGQKFFQSDPLTIPEELKFENLPAIDNVQIILWR